MDKSVKMWDVVIIGAGFSGLGMAIKLKQAGFENIVIIEKSTDVGGCWRENTYPGAACDVPSRLYSFSFEDGFDWSRRFSPQPEIHAYLRHCATKYKLWPHIQFSTSLKHAKFDESSGVWQLVSDKDELQSRVLITATGQLSRPAYPSIPGLDSFTGHGFHSAHWDHQYNLTGKTVAVIGTGASAIQFVPEVAKQVKKLLVFQRSPPWLVEKPDFEYSAFWRKWLTRYKWIRKLERLYIYVMLENRALFFTRLPKLLKLFEWQAKRYLKQQVTDPVLRGKLTPDYPLGCKRVLISNEFYDTFNRSNVELVTDAVDHIRGGQICTQAGGEYSIDAIVYGTGFAASEFLAPIEVVGLNGRKLNDEWQQGAEAYLGITVSGYPNLFMLYGPNTNLGHNSIVYMIESQIHYVVKAVQTLFDHRLKYMDVQPQVQNTFNVKVQNDLKSSVWAQGCDSWYLNEQGRNTNNWSSFTFSYRNKTSYFNQADYDRVS